MDIELIPELDPDDPAFLAAKAAIAQTGLADDVRPAGNTSAWWRAGVHEAVDPGMAEREHQAVVGRAQSGKARHPTSSPDDPVSV